MHTNWSVLWSEATCLLPQITLPKLQEEADEDRSDDEDEDEAQPMDTDEPGSEQQQQQQAEHRQAGVRLDYSRLKRNFKATTGAQEREQLDQQLRSDIDARASALARAAPNLKAVEQFNAVKVRCSISRRPDLSCPLLQLRSLHSLQSMCH